MPTVPIAAAAATTLVSLAFCLSTLERWLDRRRPYELAWTIALAEFAAASAAQWWGASMGWSAAAFRAFYLFGPILSVPELALGTVALLGSAHTGAIARRVVHTWALVSIGVLLVARSPAIDPATLRRAPTFSVRCPGSGGRRFRCRRPRDHRRGRLGAVRLARRRTTCAWSSPAR
jgi:hypothetical protein